MKTVRVLFTDGDTATYQGETAAFSLPDDGSVLITWTDSDGARGKAAVARGTWKSVSEQEGDAKPAAAPA